jgi:DNA-binding beta-propeller fold protein YncE
MGLYQTIFFVFLFVAAPQVPGFSPLNKFLSESAETGASEHLRFVREFSSAHDVKGVWNPVLDRSVDILAGPKDPESVPDILQAPYSVTTDSAHRIFVTDVRAGAVHVFDFIHSKYSILRGGDHLRAPVGVAADREDNVFVSDSVLRTILVYGSGGKFSHYLRSSRGRESYFDAPEGIAVDPLTGHIYVCDTPRHMVIMLDKKGHILGRFGTRGGGRGPGEFKDPTQVVAAGDEIIVLDSGNFRIQILDLRGHFRREIRLGYVGNHAGLAMDADKNIYVTVPQLECLRVFDHDGQLLYEFGQMGTEVGQFRGISGAWVHAGHCLYVVDSQNKRVQLFQINGADKSGC